MTNETLERARSLIRRLAAGVGHYHGPFGPCDLCDAERFLQITDPPPVPACVVKRWTMSITDYGSGPEIAPTVRENGKYVLASDYDTLAEAAAARQVKP